MKNPNRKDLILDYFENQLTAYYGTDVIRQSQVQMAIDITDFLQNTNTKKLLMIEAPVGTGKSLGVLIPTLIDKGLSKRRVLYATSTINLQGQLMREEVPLARTLELVSQPIIAKGKSHYYCHKHYEKNKKLFTDELSSHFIQFFRSSETGHRDEFESRNLPVTDSQWNRVSLTVSRRDCENCVLSLMCPTNTHRSKFTSESNDLVITNHDQLIRSVLNTMGEPYQRPIVPINPGIIIIDEAHDFQTNFLGQVTHTLIFGELKGCESILPPSLRGAYRNKVNKLIHLADEESRRVESIEGRNPLPSSFVTVLSEIGTLLNESLIRMLALDTRNNTVRQQEKIEDMINGLAVFDDEDYVSWVQYDEQRLCAISRMFARQFRRTFDKLLDSNKVIAISGTLTVNGDFNPVMEQWRVTKSRTTTVSLGTPFQYKQQAKLYVPEELIAPNGPNSEEYIANQIEHIKSLINITDGRSLILTTSKKHMDRINEGIKHFLSDKEIQLFHQSMGSVEQLTERFKHDERSVLIGSGSFFSGFSVPGKSLISVIVTKLPFPVPDDPYLELLSEGIEDTFHEVTFPHMMIKLKQAVGRLIRDIRDYGVVTILDPRVYSAGYGKIIQKEFEDTGYKLTRSESEIQSFIRSFESTRPELQYTPYDRDKLTVSSQLEEEIGSGDLAPSGRKTAESVKPQTPAITLQQREFYKQVCTMKGIKPNRRFKNPFDLFRYLFSLFYEKGESTELIKDKFPYESDEQRDNYMKYNGAGLMKVYYLSPEELAKYR